jgi:hypothetical protein
VEPKNYPSVVGPIFLNHQFLACRKNLILSDCICEQEICSTDYIPSTPTDEWSEQLATYQTSRRYLQQAMIPGHHIQSIYMCNRNAYETAYEAASIVNGNAG